MLNKKTKTLLWWLVILIILLLLGGGLAVKMNRPTSGDRSASVPTLYLHGYGAGANSAKSMMAYAQAHQGATKVLVARISPQGRVRLSGHWPKGAKHPLIQVLMEDNQNSNYQETSRWFYNLITLLQKKYQIQRYNTVAHSMGNLTTMYYQVKYGQRKDLPRLNKQVNIAGHFDGIIGIDDRPNKNYFLANGRPRYEDRYYRYLLSKRNSYPRHVRILNIYGNLNNGTNSDGDVTNVSARSLKYLLRGRYQNYQELEIKGRKGQHSQLHDHNYQVNQAIGQFLWAHP